MPHFLVSLYSITGQGAIGILDADKGLQYLQIDKQSPVVRSTQVRGIAASGEKVYVVTPASLRIYRLDLNSKGPWLRLEQEVILPEWLQGNDTQADLLPVMVSEKRKRLFIGSNQLCSIDEFDLQGKILGRRHLWEIAPEIFFSPDELKGAYAFGHIRSIVETPNGSILLTVAHTRSTENGVIVDLENGNLLLEDLNTPHGGIFIKNRFYVLSLNNGELIAYDADVNAGAIEGFMWSVKPRITQPELEHSIQNMRGMAISQGRIYCGVCHFRKTERKQISPRIVAFDAESGAQKQEVFFPDYEQFRQPSVFFISELSEELKVTTVEETVFFQYGKQIQPKPFEIKIKPKAPIADLNNVTRKRVAISAENVSLFYRRNAYFGFGKNRQLRKSREYWALRDVSFTIYEGEAVGLIGRNGSGKSTMGMLLGGTLQPDKGKVVTYGQAQLLALGVGFRNELSGRENALISGTLLGLTRQKVIESMGDIEEFSELGDFLDEPVRTYSAGMRSRLAFAVATIVDPDVLILDEVMSTGDQSFRNKAQQRMKAMQERAKTIIMVSHNPSQIKKHCSRVLWLEQGHLLIDGKPKPVLAAYEAFSQNKSKWMGRHSEIAALLNN